MEADKTTSIIQISELTKYYGKKTCAVDNLTLSVEPKEIYGFLGPNGAGKTTTIRCLLGLLHASSGTTEIMGHDSGNIPPNIRKKIGYLPGDSFLYNHFTGQEYLDFYLALYNSSNEKQQELIDLFEGIKLNSPIKTLSKGQLRMIGFITALQHDPTLIILDEPTTGLDPLKQQTVYSLIKKERKKGKTFFFSSHNLSEVQVLCDKVGIIRNGKLVKTETVENLLNVRLKKIKVIMQPELVPSIQNIFSKAEGIREVRSLRNSVEFQYSGDYHSLIKLLAEIKDIYDLTIENPSLEEIFLKYYSDVDPRS